MATNKQPSTSSSPPPGPTGTTPLAVSSLAARRIAASANESIESFADRWLTEIFRVSVDPARTVDVHGHRLTFLPGVSGEMVEAGEPLLLSAGRLDEALLEAGRLVPPGKPLLEYYLPCWKRVVRAPKAIRNLNPEKEEILKEAKRLCMSMCIFSLTMSELYKYVVCCALLPEGWSECELTWGD